MKLLVLTLLFALVGCTEPRANGPAPCCVSSTSAKPSASASTVASVVGSVEDAWTSLLAAMRAGDDAAIAKWTTPAGLASLRAGVHGEPEHTAFARWGAGWAKWEVRFKQKTPDRATASLGPEVKEHGLDFVHTPDGWKLERWSPGE